MSVQSEPVRQAILKILVVNQLRFFGCQIYSFDIKDGTDSPECPTMCVAYDRGWTIWYDSNFVANKKPEEIVYVLCHEILHAISGHCSSLRTRGRIAQIVGIAQDHVINLALDTDIENNTLDRIKIPKDRVIINYLALHHPDWSYEQVYDWLVDNVEITFMTFGEMLDHNKIPHSSIPPELLGKESPAVKVEIKKDGQRFIFFKDYEPAKGNQSQEADQAQRDLVARAKASSVASGRGLLSGSLKELLSELFDVRIPPEELLEQAIKTELTALDNRSWRSINKRLYPHGIIACAIDLEEAVGDVICLVDHSGSIAKTGAALFAGAIKNCSSLFKRLHIFYHDTKQQGEVVLINSDELHTWEELFEIRGRGGTSHEEAFKYVQEQYDTGSSISLVIVFTDWYSDIESIWDDYNWHHEVPMISVFPGRRRTIDEGKYGKGYVLKKEK